MRVVLGLFLMVAGVVAIGVGLILMASSATVAVAPAPGVTVLDARQVVDPLGPSVALLLRNDTARELEYGEVRCAVTDRAGVVIAAPWVNFLAIPAGAAFRVSADDSRSYGWAAHFDCRLSARFGQ